MNEYLDENTVNTGSNIDPTSSEWLEGDFFSQFDDASMQEEQAEEDTSGTLYNIEGTLKALIATVIRLNNKVEELSAKISTSSPPSSMLSSPPSEKAGIAISTSPPCIKGHHWDTPNIPNIPRYALPFKSPHVPLPYPLVSSPDPIPVAPRPIPKPRPTRMQPTPAVVATPVIAAPVVAESGIAAPGVVEEPILPLPQPQIPIPPQPPQPPQVPPPQSSSAFPEVVKQLKRTLVLSDSTVRNIRKMDMKSLVNKKKEDVERSMHPGATSEQIGSYIDWWLTNYRPNRLVLCAGANDLLYENRRCLENREDLCNETDIVDKVINIGIKARNRGVQNIHICSLYTIKSIYDGYTSRFNDILAKRCAELGFHFVSNSNIELCDLSDGLHVNNRQGHAKLKHNIMKCCDTYIHRNVKNY